MFSDAGLSSTVYARARLSNNAGHLPNHRRWMSASNVIWMSATTTDAHAWMSATFYPLPEQCSDNDMSGVDAWVSTD